MPFRHFHENNTVAQLTRTTMKANQSKHLVSHDRPGRYGQTVFNEMMAYINMPFSLFLLYLLFEINIPVRLNFIFFSCLIRWTSNDFILNVHLKL